MAARGLAEAMAALRLSRASAGRSLTQPVSLASTTFARSMATGSLDAQSLLASWNPVSTVPVTIHRFPSLEPASLEHWPVQHLYLPFRRDLVHLAVVYEGDATRQGTASSKTRWDGSGRARQGSRQSPLIRGGGKVFGPHPRDFSTRLNRKVYDKAWRTALSYRYRRGDLLVCEDGMDLAFPRDFDLVADRFLKHGLRETYLRKYTEGVLAALGLGRAAGRTLFVTADKRDDLFEAMAQVPWEGRALDLADVDVKDLLETGKVVVERQVLREMLEQHQSDLQARVFINSS